MKNYCYYLFSLVFILSLTGCFKVKNAEGLQLATSKSYYAQDLAKKVKTNYVANKESIPQEEYTTVKKLYEKAASDMRAFLDVVKLEATMNNVVDVPAEKFNKSPVAESIDKFINSVASRSDETVVFKEIVLPLIKLAIEEIIKARKESDEQALKKFCEELEKFKMPSWEKISIEAK